MELRTLLPIAPVGHGRPASERGAALLLVLVLSAIALVIMTTVLYMVTMGTQLSGSEKRYRTAHEAALGAVEVLSNAIQNQNIVNYGGVNIVWNGSFMGKMGSSDLTGYNTSRTIDPDDASTYDVYVELGNPAYRVYAKMVSKRPGNTEKGYKSVVTKTSVVTPAPQANQQIIPAYYTFYILSQKATNPNERIKMDLVNIF
jgi:hypothetical protein